MNNIAFIIQREEREQTIPDLAGNNKGLGEGRALPRRLLRDCGRCPLEGAFVDITPNPLSVYSLRNKVGNLIAF